MCTDAWRFVLRRVGIDILDLVLDKVRVRLVSGNKSSSPTRKWPEMIDQQQESPMPATAPLSHQGLDGGCQSQVPAE